MKAATAISHQMSPSAAKTAASIDNSFGSRGGRSRALANPKAGLC